MPLITGEEQPPSVPGAVLALVPAGFGLRMIVSAPAEGASAVPVPSAVLAWVLVADSTVAGGARIDPVFLAGGTAWTPDQFRAAFGEGVTIGVGTG